MSLTHKTLPIAALWSVISSLVIAVSFNEDD